MNNKPVIKMLSRLWLVVIAMITGPLAFAQEQVEMADTMRSNGKIYVVVAVCLIILIGLFVYVMSVDKKVRRLEKEG
jgi:K+-transporting ATPase A subunit